MSYFAGGAWRNATNVLAQATATTNNVSVSRQGSEDEAISGERKPLSRSQTDPLVKLAAQNGSNPSIASDADPAAGRRFTLRGVARALPYFLRAAPVATTTTDEAQTNVLSSSPPKETVIDLTPKAPVKRSTLVQEVLPPAENGSDGSGSPLSDGRTESVESGEERPTNARKSTSSSTGSTIVTEEPQPISSNLEDELLEAKRQAAVKLDYANLHNRIQELERENEDKASRLRLAHEAEVREREKRERIQIDIASQRTEIDQLRQSLEVAQGQSRKAEENVVGLELEINALRQKITTQDAIAHDNDSELHDLVLEKDSLQSAVRQLEARIKETERVAGEFRASNAELESERQLLEKKRFDLEEEIATTKDASAKSLSNLTATYEQNAKQATNAIQDLHSKLSVSTTKVDQLQSSLDSSSHTVDVLSKSVEEQTAEVNRLEQVVSSLQVVERSLREKVEDQASQMIRVEETAKAELKELCQKHVLDIDVERRIGRNLQSSLESLQLEMGVTEGKVTALTREKSTLLDKIEKLEERCKGGVQQMERLKTDLAKASATVRDLENKSKAMREEATKEKATLINQSTQLRRQLDDTQKQSVERYELIQRLEASKNDLTSTLRRAQTSVTEKDTMIQGMQRENASLEETRGDLERRLLDMERTLADAKETAQSVLEKTNKAHDRDMAQAKARIQELQDELSSFITTAQQLHSSLASSHAETEKAQLMADDRGQEIHRLLQHISALQDNVRSLEVKNADTLSQMNSKEQAARDAKAALLRNHTTEMDTQRRKAQGLQANLEHVLKEKEEELGSLSSRNVTLLAEVSAMKQQRQKNEEDINIAHATLRDVTERNKSTIEKLGDEKAKVEEEIERLRRRAETLEQELRERGAEVERLKITTFQKIGSSISNAFGGLWSWAGASSSIGGNHPGSILTQAH